MALSLKEWIISHVHSFDQMSPREVCYQQFFREECRPMPIDSKHFYSPADGIIIYQKIVRPKDKILEVKGVNYNLCDILMDNNLPNIEYAVSSVFMSAYDIHSNRSSMAGFLSHKKLPAIKSKNFPMIFMEKDIFTDKVNFKDRDYTYLFNNKRVVNTVYAPKLKQKYYIVQIADQDIDVISHFDTSQNVWKNTSEKFGTIRFGSQCDLIVPLENGLKVEFCQEEFYHVEGGVDRLIRIVD